jgi:hypothetical protein
MRKRGWKGIGKGKLERPLVALVCEEVGEGVADEVVEDEVEGVAGTPLAEIEHGRTRTRLAKATMIGNAAMTRRWPVPENLRSRSVLDVVCPRKIYRFIIWALGKTPQYLRSQSLHW